MRRAFFCQVVPRCRKLDLTGLFSRSAVPSLLSRIVLSCGLWVQTWVQNQFEVVEIRAPFVSEPITSAADVLADLVIFA
jgi:hypothetical protein